MRIQHQNITIKSFLFSKPMSFFYVLISIFFIYKSIFLLPIWLNVKYRAGDAKINYEQKILQSNAKNVDTQNQGTDLAKERYQKEFFNKLEEGEELIVLYGDEEKKVLKEKERKMFWWDEKKQNFLVWWRNLKFFKK